MSEAIVLVELNADRIGGHWPDRLTRLAGSGVPAGHAVDGGCPAGMRAINAPIPKTALSDEFVAGGSVVVAGDGTQLSAEFPVRDEFALLGVLIQGEQAADPGVFGIVFLLGWAAVS